MFFAPVARFVRGDHSSCKRRNASRSKPVTFKPVHFIRSAMIDLSSSLGRNVSGESAMGGVYYTGLHFAIFQHSSLTTTTFEHAGVVGACDRR